MAPSHVLRCCQRGLAWIPVIFIALVVCWSYYAYVVELCVFTVPSLGEKVIYLVVFHLCFILFVWSYWKTIFTRPTNPSKEFCLPKAEKELYEKEERPETQQEILKRVASSLPLYTRTGAGDGPSLPVGEQLCRVLQLQVLHPVPGLLAAVLPVHRCHGSAVLHQVLDTLPEEIGRELSKEAFRAPVFRNGPDKNGFSLGFSKNIAQVFGDQKKFWLLPVFTSQGDGLTFPTRLVVSDPEQPTVVVHPDHLSQSVEGEQCNSFSESQKHLLNNDLHNEDIVVTAVKSDETDTITVSMAGES
ncbi:hypothetical protein AMELA_G00221120 [Ameiurus melas]|uniref:Uncharacterized protein n=1 Tax=Ameiurus melas TaxID=219545 RepID=A0A7J5ZYB7_AMEME|nr:hypothetical protein AMELA_G00221120 [Ameiurus melas]